jgi:hypothetical protein
VKTQKVAIQDAISAPKRYSIGLHSLFQKSPKITPEKQTVQPGGASEDIAVQPGFEIVKL